MNHAVEFAAVPEVVERWLAGRPLAERSRHEYARNLRAYCAWLAVTPDGDGWQGDPLSDPLARDCAARDFRRYLQVERRASTVTWRSRRSTRCTAALDWAAERASRQAGAGRPAGPGRGGAATPAARAEAAPIRARSLVMLMLFTALRISETVAFDVDEVRCDEWNAHDRSHTPKGSPTGAPYRARCYVTRHFRHTTMV